MSGKPWTEEEIADLWKLSYEEFAAKFGRTYDSWSSARKRLRANAKAKSADEVKMTLEQQVLELLRDSTLTIKEISERVDRSIPTVEQALDKLRQDGYEVHIREEEVRLDRQEHATNWTVDLTPYYGERLRMGIISCTHFGNRYRQMGALTTFYRICEREKVAVVIHLGDVTDGIGLYRGQEFDLYAQGADEQVAATVEEYPQSGLVTKVIGGNHDYSFQRRSGTNVVRRICDQRKDLEYCGMLAATFQVGDKVKFLAMHRRGGVPYARSYASQRLNEQLGRGERVPDIFGIGGLHVNDYVWYLGVHTFLSGCFQGQTPYLKEKGLYPDIGGWIAEVNLADDGSLNRCRMEWLAFGAEGDGHE
jgi:predicted phosphodiesterase/biotin operon repressor